MAERGSRRPGWVGRCLDRYAISGRSRRAGWGLDPARSNARWRPGLESLEARELLASDLVISEFMASNDNGLRDEDRQRSDWIEVLNNGSSEVNLDGWFLTDDPDNLDKWRFPAVELGPTERIVVFASGKNRGDAAGELHTNFRLAADGDYLGLVEPDGLTVAFDFGPQYPPQIKDVSFGLPQAVRLDVPLVPVSSGTLLVPSPENGGSTLGTAWTSVEFDDSGWTDNVLGIGYERGPIRAYDDFIDTNVESSMYGINRSAYMRFPFTIDEPNQVSALTLSMQYDDGYVAYVNGQEVARRNAPDDLAWNSGATKAHSDRDAVKPEPAIIELSQFTDLLRSGNNVLAIHALNDTVDSSDFLIIPQLTADEFDDVRLTDLQYFVAPTPGIPNDIGSTVSFTNVTHTPNVPTESDPLLVTAKLTFTQGDSVAMALHYRVMFDAEVSIPMYDDGLHGDVAAGDGLYGATIPAGVAAPGQMIRYRVTAGEGESYSQSPVYPIPLETSQYYGTVVFNPAVQSNSLVFDVFLEDPAGADIQPGTYGSLFHDGKFYDNVFIDPSGRSVGLAGPKKSHDIFFPQDNWLELYDGQLRMNDFVVISDYFNREKMRVPMGYETFTQIGTPSHLSLPVRWEMNGEFYGTYFFVDGGNEEFLQRAGLDRNGALYKMNLGFNVGTGQYKKMTRQYEPDTDLKDFFANMALTGDDRIKYIMDNVNIPAMVNYLVGLVIMAHGDCCGKNLYIYRDTEGSGEWQALPYDVDSAFGRGGLPPFSLELYYPNYTGAFAGGGNVLTDTLFKEVPGFSEMYLRRLRTLIDEFVQVPETPTDQLKFEQWVDQLAAQIAPDVALDMAKWGSWSIDPETEVISTEEFLTWEEQLDLFRNRYFPERRDFLYKNLTGDRRGKGFPDQIGAPPIQIGDIDFNPVSGDQDEEYIQLTNPNNVAVDISGWQLVGGIQHTFAPGTVIPAGGNVYVSPNVKAFRARATGPTGGQGLFIIGGYDGHLPNQGSSIALVALDGTQVDQAETATDLTPEQQFLRISEFMYHPHDVQAGSRFETDDFEFIELVNTSTTETLDLQHVALRDGVDFEFPQMLLGPGERVVVVNHEEAFRQRYGDDINVAGQYGGTMDAWKLSNGGETIRLEIATGDLIQEFTYEDDWVPSTDGDGYSLTVTNELAPLSQWMVAAGWRASDSLDGTPGRAETAPGDFDGDGLLSASDIDLFCGGLRSANSAFDLTGDGVVDETDLVVLIEGLMGTSFGDANLDGVFDSNDLIQVLAASEYEDDIPGNSTWTEGDWDCDGDFTTSDLFQALQAGTYLNAAIAVETQPLSPVTALAADAVCAALADEVALSNESTKTDDSPAQSLASDTLLGDPDAAAPPVIAWPQTDAGAHDSIFATSDLVSEGSAADQTETEPSADALLND